MGCLRRRERLRDRLVLIVVLRVRLKRVRVRSLERVLKLVGGRVDVLLCFIVWVMEGMRLLNSRNKRDGIS